MNVTLDDFKELLLSNYLLQKQVERLAATQLANADEPNDEKTLGAE